MSDPRDFEFTFDPDFGLGRRKYFERLSRSDSAGKFSSGEEENLPPRMVADAQEKNLIAAIQDSLSKLEKRLDAIEARHAKSKADAKMKAAVEDAMREAERGGIAACDDLSPGAKVRAVADGAWTATLH